MRRLPEHQVIRDEVQLLKVREVSLEDLIEVFIKDAETDLPDVPAGDVEHLSVDPGDVFRELAPHFHSYIIP
jgi:hypothetical protein